MTVFKHEWRQGFKSWLIWTLSIGALVVLINLIWPDMAESAQGWSQMFRNLGMFGDAFGLDQLDLGEFLDFYGLEVNNILGIGAALYAAITGINSLASEEGRHTAEFLFSHPVSRLRITLQKLLAVLTQVTALHAVVLVLSYLSIQVINEAVDLRLYLLFHIALWLMTVQIALLCFAVSSLLTQENIGLGIGAALLLYFFNLLANISEQLEMLKYLTPFAYADPTAVLAEGTLDLAVFLPQLAVCIGLAAAGLAIYSKRDLRA